MGDDAARHHICTIADAGGVVPDCRRRRAELLQIGEAGNAGAVPPDSGIVEDRGGGGELRGEIGRVDAAMRGVDDNRAPRVLFGNSGNAVGNDDRRGAKGHRGGSQGDGERLRRHARSAQACMPNRFVKGESRLSPGQWCGGARKETGSPTIEPFDLSQVFFGPSRRAAARFWIWPWIVRAMTCSRRGNSRSILTKSS